MGRVNAATVVPLGPEAATTMWRDARHWSGFVEGFQRMEEQSADWPAEGAKVIWHSGVGGRGRVSEKVIATTPTGFSTRVAEDRLLGLQTFEALEDGEGSRVELSLEYELADPGPLRAVMDVLFIRRALRDALTRTLGRFAVEAQDQAGLR
jgi:Polyketide cyclase / dehydrase and lipid transport